MASENESQEFGFVSTEGQFNTVDLQIVIVKALKYGVKLLKVRSKGAVGDQGDVIDEADDVLHIGEEQGHFLLIDVGADGETHGEALIGVLAPWKDEGGKALAVFIELDCPEAHVQVKNRDVGKSVDVAHDFLNGGKGKRASAKMAVEHVEVSHETDLVVLLGDGECLCRPFGVVGAAENSNVTKAFNFGLEEWEKGTRDLVGLAMVGFDIGIGELEMDGFAGKFAEFARKKKSVLLEDMPNKSMTLCTIKVSWNHVVDFNFFVISG